MMYFKSERICMKICSKFLSMTLSLVLWTALGENYAFAENSLKVASFNLQVFGPSKVKKPLIRDVITKILARYDLIALQEIRDQSDLAIYELLENLVEETQRPYESIVSDRLGRGSMKEQYAFIYDTSKVTVVNSYLFQDLGDKFEREPFVVKFDSGELIFSMINIHTTPKDVNNEIAAFNGVLKDIHKRFSNKNHIIVGDFNADCNYYKNSLDSSTLDETAKILIDDDMDTTTGATNCAYDRAMAFGPLTSLLSSGRVFNFQNEFNLDLATAKLISDHYPIEFDISLNE